MASYDPSCGERHGTWLVRKIAKALVDNTDEVKVREVVGARSVVIEVDIPPSDRGKFIGKKWVHKKAIETLLHALGGREKTRYVLSVIED